MLKDILERLIGGGGGPQPQIDSRIALAALMVRCAKVDHVYDPAEIAMIDTVLADRYGLTPQAAAALRDEGAVLEAETGDTVHLTKAIKAGVPYDDRIAVVEALWRVVLADDDRDHEENAFLRLVVSLIGVNDRDSGLARQKVERDG